MHSSSEFGIIVLHVDDLIIASNMRASIDRIKGEFKKRFEMKDMGEESEVLGLTRERDHENKTLFIHQKSYAETVLE